MTTGPAVPPAVVDEQMIERLIRAFYANAKHDPLIGPVFESKVHDWDAHIGQMCAFWSAIMLGTNGYRGRPMAKHLTLPIDGGHFERWLAIFSETAREVCPARAAAEFIDQAARIRVGLQAGVEMHGRNAGEPRLDVVQ